MLCLEKVCDILQPSIFTDHIQKERNPCAGIATKYTESETLGFTFKIKSVQYLSDYSIHSNTVNTVTVQCTHTTVKQSNEPCKKCMLLAGENISKTYRQQRENFSA